VRQRLKLSETLEEPTKTQETLGSREERSAMNLSCSTDAIKQLEHTLGHSCTFRCR
jgi:hypothetical protein